MLRPGELWGFAINATSKLLFFKTDIVHDGSAIHEQITEEGIRLVTPGATARFIYNLQRGVENTDLTHQFDSESHFDNCNPENEGFEEARTRMLSRFRQAQSLAVGNPEFLDPSYQDFLEIARATADTLAQLAIDANCLGEPGCPTADALKDSATIAGVLPALILNPSPDPHWPTAERSLFSPSSTFNTDPPSGLFGDVNEVYLDIISLVSNSVERALGPHRVPRVCFPDLLHPQKPTVEITICAPFFGSPCYTYTGDDPNPAHWTFPEICPGCGCDRTLAETLGSRNGYVTRLIRLRQAIRAYLAFQELGHALHAAQDFFAHTDYVELMASQVSGHSIQVGDSIERMTTLNPGDIPIPTQLRDFSEEGLSRLMGEDFRLLESGAVRTIWLGEGDYSLGDAGVFNAFNPNTRRQLGGFVSPLPGILPDIPSFEISPIGRNPQPPPGFHHGHYRTSTHLGLNKDTPDDIELEPSHANHGYARNAAVRFTAVMWRHFLTFGADDPGGAVIGAVQLDCPHNVTVYALPGETNATVNYPLPIAQNATNPRVECLPPSGSRFPVGRTVVECTVRDDRGGSDHCSFLVTVLQPEARDRVLVTPTSITQLRGDTLPGYAFEGLISGEGLREEPTAGNFATVPHGESGLWATATQVGGNYFEAQQPPPTFLLHFDGTYPLSDLVVWGYLGNNNEATDFLVEFSRDSGITWEGPEAVSSPRLLRDGAMALPFSSSHEANAVRLTLVNNAGGRGFDGIGTGDRVGLGELRFIATPRLELVTPIAVTQRVGDTLEGFPLQNLIQGSGLSGIPTLGNYADISQGVEGRWVTATETFPANYFAMGRPAPVLEFELDALYRLTDLVVWGYAGNNNEATDFRVEFSMDGGRTYTRQAVVSSPQLLGTGAARLWFQRGMLANKVRLTLVNNGGARGFAGIGPGDRVGLGKVRFAGSRIVQRQGADLGIHRVGTQLRLDWPRSRSGWVLETSDRLGGEVWTPVEGVQTNEYLFPIGVGPQYFRLRYSLPTDALLHLDFDGNTANSGLDGAIQVSAKNIFRYVGDRDRRGEKAVDLANLNDTRAGGLITTENLVLGTDFSFAFWMKHDGAFGTSVPILGQGNWFALYIHQERVRFGPLLQGMAIDPALDPAAPAQLDPGIWHHYVGSVRQTGENASEARLYVDGALSQVRSFDRLLQSPVDCRFFLGSQPEGEDYCQAFQPAENGRFNGALDDVRVFARALSDAEVGALSNERFDQPPPKNPVPTDAVFHLGLDGTTLNRGTDTSLTVDAKNTFQFIGDRRGRDQAALDLYNDNESGRGGRLTVGNPGLGTRFTLSLWVKPQLSADAILFGQGNWFNLYQAGGRMHFGLTQDETPAEPLADVAESRVFPLGFWRHYVAVLTTSDSGSPVAQLYVNGQLQGTRSYTTIPPAPSHCLLHLGSRPQGSDYCNEGQADTLGGNYPGAVDDVRIFRRALTQAEIQALSEE